MALRDLFRRRRPVDTDAIDAIQEAEMARQRTVAHTRTTRARNDSIEGRIEQNHFGEALAKAWREATA